MTDCDIHNLDSDVSSDLETWVSCELLVSRWGCSPYDIIEIIKDESLQVECFSNWNLPLNAEKLGEFSVHKNELLKFEQANAEYVKSLSVISPLSSSAGQVVLESENTVTSTNQKKQAPRPARNRDYVERMPMIVGLVLEIKKDWDEAGENSPKRKHGFIDGEIASLAQKYGTRRELWRAIKKVLPQFGIEVWQGGVGPRPTD